MKTKQQKLMLKQRKLMKKASKILRKLEDKNITSLPTILLMSRKDSLCKKYTKISHKIIKIKQKIQKINDTDEAIRKFLNTL